MSQMLHRNRGMAVFIAMLAGFLIGIFSTLYMISNWVPGELLYREATPLTLARRGVTGDYRDFYLTYVANRYAALAPVNPREALNMARNMLGVTTGDASAAQAAEMAASTLQVATTENDREVAAAKDAGWFSRADESNLAKLAQQLTLTKNEAINVVNAPGDGWLSAKSLARILSLLPILLALIAAGLLIMWLTQAAAPDLNGLGSIPPADPQDPTGFDGAVTQPYQSQPPAQPADVQSTPSAPSNTAPAATYGAPTKPLTFTDPPVTVNAPAGPKAAYGNGFTSVSAPISRPSYADMTATSDESASVTGQSIEPSLPAAGGIFVSAPQTFPAIEYVHGDENFDQDFDITGPKGLLIGTCGANIGERVGLTQPGGANALMISVFDKAAFKTSSKVLILPELRNDAVLVRKLREKGELVDAHEGGDIVIDTQTLKVTCKVTNLEIADEGDPARSYFRNVRLTFTSQQRA